MLFIQYPLQKLQNHWHIGGDWVGGASILLKRHVFFPRQHVCSLVHFGTWVAFRWPSLWEVPIRLLEAFQRRIPWSAKNQRRRECVAEEKKSEMQWQGNWLYSQVPLPFWRAMAGCIAIGSLATAVHWLIFLILQEPITCSYNCMIEIGFSWRGKLYFSQTRVDTRRSTSEISKGKHKPFFRQWCQMPYMWSNSILIHVIKLLYFGEYLCYISVLEKCASVYIFARSKLQKCTYIQFTAVSV